MSDPILFRLADAAKALEEIRAAGKRPFTVEFTRGTLVLELYGPRGLDDQQPHSQDELYVVARGTASFTRDGATVDCAAGDVVFAAAGVPHRFENMSDEFETWVIFYGPEGGEIPRD